MKQLLLASLLSLEPATWCGAPQTAAAPDRPGTHEPRAPVERPGTHGLTR
jgi:hypothetical protein